ncbi:MAG: PIN domain-containing protein [Spirochaetales bacterium]
MIFLDTHAAIFLTASSHKISRKVWKTLEQEELVLSPMVRLEFEFLHESGSIREEPMALFENLARHHSVTIETEGWARAAEIAQVLNWTRDPFDRLIVAHAMVWSAPLLTRDALMHQHYTQAFWDDPPLTSAS